MKKFLAPYRQFWHHYFDVHGRMSRNDFWMSIWWNFLIYLLIIGYIMAYKQKEGAIFGIFVFVMYSLAAVIPLLTSLVRRYNDTKLSAWWLLLTFVLPIILAFQSSVGLFIAAGLSLINLVILWLPEK